MDRLYIDIETFSGVDLKKTNVYRYVEDPDFSILMAAWAINDEPVQVAIGQDEIDLIPGLWDPLVEKVAHNAQFERVCFSRFLTQQNGDPWPLFLPPEEWLDTMAVAAELGYPQSLDQLGKALEGELKDSAGTALVTFFCKPNRKGVRNLPEDHPEKWAQFVGYCRQDVVTMRDALHNLDGFPTRLERAVWNVDQRINDRGIRMDTRMARQAIAAAEDNRMGHEIMISSITGVANPGSVEQLSSWLRRSGLRFPNLAAETVEKLLARTDLTTDQRTVLELRQELALVASNKYLAADRSVSSDGRLRGQFRFFGAHTGRWSGRGVQLHNLPRAQLGSDDETAAAILDLSLGLGADAKVLKQLVRALFQIDGVVADYAAIEARVVAWLAGEQWALDAFSAGRDIYVETAQRMGGLTRSQGKVAVLALGYNGGINSLRVMGGQGSDEELENMVYTWRRANPHTVKLWKNLGEAFQHGGKVGKFLTVERYQRDRLLRLPSGRALIYHDVQLRPDAMGRPRLSFADPRRPGWRTDTYGGRLTENATQAVARDLLAEALVRLDKNGYRVVGHVHDEVLTEDTTDVDGVVSVMCESPSWAPGLPIGAEGFYTNRYRKG